MQLYDKLYFNILVFIWTRIGIKTASRFHGVLSDCRCETVNSCSGSFSPYGNVSGGVELFSVGLKFA